MESYLKLQNDKSEREREVEIKEFLLLRLRNLEFKRGNSLTVGSFFFFFNA